MKNSIRFAGIGFAAALAFSALAAQAAQPPQHDHPTASPAQKDQMAPARNMRLMMADPAMRQKMMEQMDQRHDMMSMMMSMMMDHMGRQGEMPKQPSEYPKR